jgi:hypothetical protein
MVLPGQPAWDGPKLGVPNIMNVKNATIAKAHIAKTFAPLATKTEISECGKNEAKITFLVNGQKMTSYIRTSKGKFIIQMPFKKAGKFVGEKLDRSFWVRDTSKQAVFEFPTAEILMEKVEEVC